MADKTKIEWTARRNPDGTVTPGATWTPLQARRRDTGKTGVHCVKVSAECKNCYAERFNQRGMPAHGTGLPFTVLNTEKVEMFLNPGILEQPLKWKRPRTIFVCSQTDLFGEFVPDELIDRVFTVMALCPQHRFLVLTKRAERMHRYITGDGAPDDESMRDRMDEAAQEFEACHADMSHPERWPLPNVWLGVTAGTQKSWDERAPWLCKTPAAKRFVSCEPLLEEINTRFPSGASLVDFPAGFQNWTEAKREEWIQMQARATCMTRAEIGIDWVIVGGESGPGARPMHPDWARSLRDQCVAAGVPFHFKQWGEWQNGSGLNPANDGVVLNDGMVLGMALNNVDYEVRTNWHSYRSTVMSRVGKKAAGRLLDGREWNEVPSA